MARFIPQRPSIFLLLASCYQERRGAMPNIAEGSVEECRYFLILTKDLGYGDAQKLFAMLEEVSRLRRAYAAAILASGS